MKKKIGGNRLGSGAGMDVWMRNYGRSTHDIGFLMKTDQAAGTLVPYWCQIMTNGTTMEVDITTKVRTIPTLGPVFGSFKHQIDIFKIPIRLYLSVLHNNALNIGKNMKEARLPMMMLHVAKPNMAKTNPNESQIAQDSLLRYLGLAGLGYKPDKSDRVVGKQALFLLAYWDIYKNYYANKQEEEGVVVGLPEDSNIGSIIIGENLTVDPDGDAMFEGPFSQTENGAWKETRAIDSTNVDHRPIGIVIQIAKGKTMTKEEAENILVTTSSRYGGPGDYTWRIGDKFEIHPQGSVKTEWFGMLKGQPIAIFRTTQGQAANQGENERIKLVRFPLENIDLEREAILAAPKGVHYNVSEDTMPYAASIKQVQRDGDIGIASVGRMAGLGIKTYQSDRFNNWLNTDWIDGENGINEITSVTIVDGKLSMDALILQKKLYDMANRIAISDGTYYTWQEVTYDEQAISMDEIPIYVGGMSSEMMFDEVVSTAETETGGNLAPLGSLGGRGSDRAFKGGRSIKIKATEPCIVMAIGSFTPRLDYSQGNEWWTRLETMDDLHQPGLDGIGFQELITEEMAATSTEVLPGGNYLLRSAGKQPAWTEYTTETNKAYGSFGYGGSLDFMALNRGYELNGDGTIKDMTTYVDPRKSNHIFADESLLAKNFWVQVAFDIKARRKMSAPGMPTL